jgi:hypothetical protein
MGVFDWISEKIGSVYDSVKHHVGHLYAPLAEILPTLPTIGESLTKTIEQWSRGEYHAPGGYNYCGPGTKLDSAGRPINKADSACRVHDYEYEALGKQKGKISQEDFNRMIRESDNKLVDAINRSGQTDIGSQLSKWGIKGKMALEDLGILNRDKFIG